MAVKNTAKLAFSFRYDLGESGWNTGYDVNWSLLDLVLNALVVSATTIAEPGAPANGDAYIIPTGATGTNWAGQDGKLGLYDGVASGGADSWVFLTPIEGMLFSASDTGQKWQHQSSAWVQYLARLSAKNGITASVTQTQGQQPLTANINEVSVVATTNDVVTAPALLAGMPLTIINNGANTLQVYPALGEDIGAGVNISITIIAGAVAKFEAYASGIAEQII